jgi:preprotein translocase subunit SecG
MSIKNIIEIIQIIVSILLVIAVLLQQRGSGLGGIFGGGQGEFYHKRRGFETLVFRSTIVLAALLFLSSIAIFFLSSAN